MPEDKKSLEKQVVIGTIELIERIANNKTNAITLDNGSVFYRAESHVLKAIAEEPGIFSSEIARRFSVTRGAIQKILGRLEERCLIAKEVDDSDKKRIRLFLTETGKQSFELLVEYQMKTNAAFFSEVSSMTADELATVYRFLSTAQKVLEKMQNSE